MCPGEDKTAANADLEYEFRANGECVVHRDGKPVGNVPGRYAVDPGPDPDVLDIAPTPDLPLNGSLRGIYRIDRDTLTGQYRSNQGRGPPYRPRTSGRPPRANRC